MKKRIIGLVGRRGSGKNFVADRIEEVFKGKVEKAALADPIKRFAIDVLGLDEKLVYGNDLDKSAETKYKWECLPDYLFSGPIRLKFVSSNREGRKSLTIRDILQIVGTELGREIWGSDIWIRAMENRVKRSKAACFIVTDVRFPNEAAAIRSWGGQVWKVAGKQRGVAGAAKDAHPSETGVDDIPLDDIDRIVANEEKDTKETIKRQIRKLLSLRKMGE